MNIRYSKATEAKRFNNGKLLRPEVCSNAFVSQVTEELQCMVSLQSLHTLWYFWLPLAPAAVIHQLTAEVQLEEELVHQLRQLCAAVQLNHQGDLHSRGVDVQLERHEVTFTHAHGLHEVQGVHWTGGGDFNRAVEVVLRI